METKGPVKGCKVWDIRDWGWTQETMLQKPDHIGENQCGM